jgi:hypothetical protein
MGVRVGFALREVRNAFEQLTQRMQQMHPAFQVNPSDASSAIPSGSLHSDSVVLECNPVTCLVPERASHDIARLYIVFTGSLTLASELLDGHLLTDDYMTNFGYFAVSENGATHVLGGHYDFSPIQFAHPRAHMQLRSQVELYPAAQSSFHSLTNVPLEHDLMTGILNRVRPPSAQMDFLSFMLQICADHLVDEKSSASVVSMFDGLVASCSPLLGYHASTNTGCGCHRAPHWYPRNTLAGGQ